MWFKRSWRTIVSGAIVVLGGLLVLGVSPWQIFLVLLALACPLLHLLGLHGGHGGHRHEEMGAEKSGSLAEDTLDAGGHPGHHERGSR
ncbi:MAG: DUF2933 domain-containing protein [candidate division NC10 bacterium]|nr:DUF2933 domain-containing protein [candidate division NC10 bacterium]